MRLYASVLGGISLAWWVGLAVSERGCVRAACESATLATYLHTHLLLLARYKLWTLSHIWASFCATVLLLGHCPSLYHGPPFEKKTRNNINNLLCRHGQLLPSSLVMPPHIVSPRQPQRFPTIKSLGHFHDQPCPTCLPAHAPVPCAAV